MDALDRKILTELQLDGRLTVTELAARVQLSVSPCHRRLRDLEREGAIRGYRAVVDPAAVGLNFEALVFATLRWEDRDTVTAFEEAVTAIPQVIQAQRLFGEPDRHHICACHGKGHAPCPSPEGRPGQRVGNARG
ncbi:Lrp/AsnC family transcriptional regulator, partial [Streptomyces tanashiensis]